MLWSLILYDFSLNRVLCVTFAEYKYESVQIQQWFILTCSTQQEMALFRRVSTSGNTLCGSGEVAARTHHSHSLAVHASEY